MIFGRQIYNTHLRDKIEYYLTASQFNDLISGSNRPLILIRGVLRELINRYKDENVIENTYIAPLVFIYSLIMNIRPKNVLCLGSHRGLVPAICALACQENKFGHVDYLTDNYEKEKVRVWLGIPWWEIYKPRTYYSPLNIHKYIKLIKNETSLKYNNKKYQCIVINMNRAEINVNHQIKFVLNVLEKEGVIILHNIGMNITSQLDKFNIKHFKQQNKTKSKNIIQINNNLYIIKN